MKILPHAEQIIVKPRIEVEFLISDKDTLCLYGDIIAVGENVEARGKYKVDDVIAYEKWGLKSPRLSKTETNMSDKEGKVHFIREDSQFLLGKILEF